MNKNSIFQVNLEGVLRILSESLYSTPNVFLRELLQNSVDAITAREQLEKFNPDISISYYSNPNGKQGLIFTDNGVGLNMEEVEQFLSRIGASSKSLNNMMDDRSSYIGQFGIGMLSCFMVSDEIVVRTRSARGKSEPVKWVGKIDGTYDTMTIDEDIPVGTSVVLGLRSDLDLDEDILYEVLKKFATFIKVPVRLYVDDNPVALPQQKFSWEEPGNQALFIEQGAEFFGEHMDYGFDISLPELKTTGKAYVLNRSTHHGELGSTRVYIKNMLIAENNHDILPEWAFFIRLVINSSHLSPTASREDVFKNGKMNKVREAIGLKLKEHIRELGENYPDTLKRILYYHTVAFKSLAINDPDFFQMIYPLFSYETSRGTQTLGQLMKENSTLLYVTDTDEFGRILPIARANDSLIINAGYIYDFQLLSLLADTTETHLVQRINAGYFGNSLKDLDPDLLDLVESSLSILQEFIEDYECELSVKAFEPSTLPGLYYLSDDARKAKDMQIIKEESNDLWSFVADTMSNPGKKSVKATLMLNANNQVVLRLLRNPKAVAARILLETILFNTMMQSNVPLSGMEQTQMNSNLNYLLENLK